MKLSVDLDTLAEKPPVKRKLVSFRISQDDYDVLRDHSENVSHTVRALIEMFVDEIKKDRNSWTRRR
jgi:hypothetical protein